MKRLQLFCLCLLLPAFLFSADFGLITGGYAAYLDSGVEYEARIIPRFSLPVGDNGDFLVTAAMSVGKDDADEFYYTPELLRTAFSLRFGEAGITIGRMHYADPLGLIADGLFDGVQFYYAGTAGTLRVGAWYTGFLYKKTANITMTAEELGSWYKALDYGDFANTYFAPKRAIVSIDWEQPSLGEFMRLNAALTGQFDLNGGDETYNSQYLTLKAGIPVKNWLIELGGSVEVAQAEDETSFAYAADFGIFCALPSAFNSSLSLSLSLSSGRVDDTFRAFVPITTKYYGNVFREKLSGLSVAGLNYTALFVPTLGASITARHFIRNDLGTYAGYPIPAGGSDNYFLGTEFFARLLWSPVSDLQFNLGGGAFLPSLGNVGTDQDMQWRMELTVVLSLY
jgi:hypothetical protein